MKVKFSIIAISIGFVCVVALGFLYFYQSEKRSFLNEATLYPNFIIETRNTTNDILSKYEMWYQESELVNIDFDVIEPFDKLQTKFEDFINPNSEEYIKLSEPFNKSAKQHITAIIENINTFNKYAPRVVKSKSDKKRINYTSNVYADSTDITKKILSADTYLYTLELIHSINNELNLLDNELNAVMLSELNSGNYFPIILIVVLAIIIALVLLVYFIQNNNEKEFHKNKKRLSMQKDKIDERIEFVNDILEGNFQISLNADNENNILNSTLIKLKDKLKNAQTDAEAREKEAAIRNWTTEGIAKFSDLLRQNTDNLNELSFIIIENLVHYIKANQGGVFLYNDDDKSEIHLELMASYAYSRRKYLNKKIIIGEGLIGTCAIEKETIYMTNIPKNYIEITSGLGKAIPDCLLIVPLKIESATDASDSNLLGIIEIASFNTFADYEIKFVEKIAETIASTLSAARINQRTVRLLNESKMQTEEMISQEEEMRQNLEELQATQEEMNRKQNEIEEANEKLQAQETSLKTALLEAELKEKEIINKNEQLESNEAAMRQNMTELNAARAEAARIDAEARGFVNSVNHTIIRADFNLEGKLEYANTKFLDLMEYAFKDIKDQPVSFFIDEKDLVNFKEQWDRILIGGKHIEQEMRHVTKTGKTWLLSTFTPIKSPDGNVTKILYLAIDINMQKEKNLEVKEVLKAIDMSIIKAEYHADGRLIRTNDMLLSTLGYEKEEIEGKDVFWFVLEKDLKKFTRSWNRVATKGLPYDAKLCKKTKRGGECWLRETYSAVYDFDRKISKIVYFAYDITKQMKTRSIKPDSPTKLDK